MKLDYSTLSQPVTKADIAAYKAWQRQAKPANPLVATILYIIGGIVLGSILFMLIVSVASGTADAASFITPIIVIVVGTIVGIAVRANIKHTAKLYKFAAANGLTFIANAANPGYPGMIFEEGHSRSVIASFLLPNQTQIGNYQYVTGSGKNRQTHAWGFVRFKLPRRLPHMVLDAKKNNLFGKFSNLPASFRGQTLSLEGDFDTYFTLYAPKEYERDALYVFTPDVMAAAIDSGHAYDMEVIDDYLVLYTKGRFDLASEKELTSLLTIITIIGGEIHDQSKRYADERIGDRSLNIVAEPGRRLKSRLTVGAIIGGALAILFIILQIVMDILSVID